MARSLKLQIQEIKVMCYIWGANQMYRERGGVVVERRTPNREILGSIPTSVTVLCP